jgi:cobalt-zinc-cadmium efflux system outer membrane protein
MESSRLKSPLGPTMLVLVILAGLCTTPAFAQEGALGASLDSLLGYAREHNPEYSEVRFEADAAGERVIPAGALPDPTLRLELENITNYGTDARPSVFPSRVGDMKYTLMQPLPFWGKRDLKREVAEADAAQAKSRVLMTWNDLAARIKAAYAQYYVVTAIKQLNQEIFDLMQRLERVAQVRYATGLGAQQDVIRSQVEQTGLRSELIGIEDEQRQLQAQINALLSRNALAPLSEPKLLRPLPASSALEYTVLAERVRSRNPQLFAEDARIRSAEKSRDLTYRNRYPDFVLGVIPTQTGSRVNTWGLMLEMNIPLQQESRRSQEREAESMVSVAQSRKLAASNQILSELAGNLASFDAAHRTEVLTGTSLVPQAKLTFEAALVGKVDFATLLDAQRQIRQARQTQIKAQGQGQARLAEIERLLGEDL